MANGWRVFVCTCAQVLGQQKLAERWAKGWVHYLSRPRLSTGSLARCHDTDNDGEL